jgi:hypothetical protein
MGSLLVRVVVAPPTLKRNHMVHGGIQLPIGDVALVHLPMRVIREVSRQGVGHDLQYRRKYQSLTGVTVYKAVSKEDLCGSVRRNSFPFYREGREGILILNNRSGQRSVSSAYRLRRRLDYTAFVCFVHST